MRPNTACAAVRVSTPHSVAALTGSLIAAVVAVFSGPAYPAVFGPDNRTPLPASHRHLEGSIGILYEARTRTICTAFCAGDDIIATASHCVFRTSGETAPRLSGFTFRPASKAARTEVKIAGVEKGGGPENILSGSTSLSIRPPIEATRDWALVRLASPVCRGRSLSVSRRTVPEIKALAEAGRVYQVGYHHDMPTMRLVYGNPCWMRRGETSAERETINRDFAGTRDLVLHSCDTGGGSSGSPLLVDTLTGPEVVAINVGTYVRSKVLMQNGDVVHRYKSDTIANTAVAGGAFAETLTAFSRAEILSGRDRLKQLQALLAERGHYRGPRDGVYGAGLRTAIENLERAERRPVTGIASADLFERLIASKGVAHQLTVEESKIETGSVTAPKAKRK